jgi:hypothetical protein
VDRQRISPRDLNAFRLRESSDADVEENPGPSDIATFLARGSFGWVARAFKGERKKRSRLKTNISKVWRAPLRRLEAILSIASYVGTILNGRLRADVDQRSKDLVEALTRVHARCIQVSWEIDCLLTHGFADGAIGRWRSLHEHSLVTLILAAAGDDLARRFLDHVTVQQAQLARRYEQHAGSVGFEPLGLARAVELKEQEAELKARYGKDFDSMYGWAASVCGNPRPKLNDLEDLCELSYLRMFTHDAGNNVHASAKGAFIQAGLSRTRRREPEKVPDVLLAGPSDEGLADPIQLTSLSVVNATVALASVASDEQVDVLVDLLLLWHGRLTGDLGHVVSG